MSAPKLGSGERFRKLSSTLAARGASNPDALAAWIGRRKYGAKKFGKLSSGSSHSITGQAALLFAEGDMRTCPNCGYKADDADFAISGGASGTSDSASSSLQTPTGNVSSTAAGMNAGQIGVAAGRAAGALSNTGQTAREFAGLTVTSPWDIMVSRGEDGAAVIRHRRGGTELGKIRHLDDGTWKAEVDGKLLEGRTHQRAAMMDLLATHNHRTTTPQHRAAPLQPPAVQTPLMQKYGIPAVRAFATPASTSSDGGRMTTNGAGDNDSGGMAGLTPKGVTIFKKLKAKGFPDARAMAFAKRAQSFGG